jgi:hypothetical protein
MSRTDRFGFNTKMMERTNEEDDDIIWDEKWTKRLKFLVIIATILWIFLNFHPSFGYHALQTCYVPNEESMVTCKTTDITKKHGLQTGNLIYQSTSFDVKLYVTTIERIMICIKTMDSSKTPIILTYQNHYLNISEIELQKEFNFIEGKYPLNIEERKWYYKWVHCLTKHKDVNGIADEPYNFDENWISNYILIKSLLILCMVMFVSLGLCVYLVVDITRNVFIAEKNTIV